MIFILLYIYENTDFESLYIGYYTSELHFLPVKSENKKICKEVDENQRLWYDKKKA